MANLIKSTKNMKELMEETKSVKSEEVTLNDIPVGFMGYTSESEKEEGLKFLQTIVDATDGSPSAVMALAIKTMRLKAKGLSPDDAVEKDDEMYYIDYSKRVLFNDTGDILASVDDEDLVKEKMSHNVIKALLLAQI